MIKNVLWDWNGTLLDDATVAATLVNAGFAALGKTPVTLDQMRKAYTIPIRDFYSSLGATEEEFNVLAKHFITGYTEAFPTIQLRSSVVETLIDFETRGVRQFVLSSHVQLLLEEGLKQKSIRAHFSSVYALTADGAGRSKLEIGRLLLSDHLLVATESVLIGDSVHDYEVARELGMGCVLLAGGHQCESQLRQTGAPVAETVADLPLLVFGK